MAAVVHAHQRHRCRAGNIAVPHQRGDDGHRVAGFLRSVLQVRLHRGEILALQVPQRVSLFRNRKGHHLQAGRLKDALQFAPVFFFRGGSLQPAGQRGDDLPVRTAVRPQGNHQGQGVVRNVDPVDDLPVPRLRGNDAPVRQSLVQQPLLQARDKAPEDIARAEMHPYRILFCRADHLLTVIPGQSDFRLLPGSRVSQPFICQLHTGFLLRFRTISTLYTKRPFSQ